MVFPFQQHGIGAADLKKLAEAGYNTIESIAFTGKKKLIEVKGITEVKADKLLEAASKMVPMVSHMSNVDI